MTVETDTISTWDTDTSIATTTTETECEFNSGSTGYHLPTFHGVTIEVSPPTGSQQSKTLDTKLSDSYSIPTLSVLEVPRVMATCNSAKRTARLKQEGKKGVDKAEFISQIREIANLNGIDNQLSEEILEVMARETFDSIGLNCDRHILTFEQFEGIMRDIDYNISEFENSLKNAKPPPKKSLSFYFFNKKLVRFAVFLSILLIACFVWYFVVYAQKDDEIALHSWSLPFAKGSAQVIKLCLVLLTLTGTKRVSTYLRDSWLQRVLPFNHFIAIHKFLGILVCIASLVHVICHVVNVKNKTDSSRAAEWHAIHPNDTQPSVGDVLKSDVAITGVILTIILFVSIPFAISFPSSFLATKFKMFASYDKFIATHMLLVCFIVLSCFHPLPSLPFATNGAALDHKPNTLWWLIVPLMLYFYEHAVRFIHGRHPVRVLSCEIYSKKVVELKIRKPKWLATPKCGQYILLRDSDINGEWHPFTLSSCPEDKYLMVHIKSAGDWTEALLQKYWKIICMPDYDKKKSDLGTTISVDGPFSAPAEDIHTRFSSCVLIGVGIGSTPFVSAARSLLYPNGKRHTRLKKLEMIFVSQDIPTIAWLKTGLNNLNFEEIKDIEITVSIYLTCAKGLLGSSTPGCRFFNFGHKSVYSKTGKDLLTGFDVQTQFGRPDWDGLFRSARNDKSAASQIGVFACGPEPVTDILNQMCDDYSDRKVCFKFIKEVF